MKTGVLSRLIAFVRPDTYLLCVILFSLFFFIFYLSISLFRLSVFDPNYDTVIFNQAFWNTIHEPSLLVNSFEGGSHFGVHFSPLLFSVIPFYLLYPGPETLFIIKCFLITIGVFPVYFFARELLGDKNGCILTLIYFFYPAVQGMGYCDFYETSFIPFFLGLTLLGFLLKYENLMLVSGIVCLLIKEDVSLVICMVGISGLWINRDRPLKDNWRFVLFIILSLCVLASFLLLIKPAFSPGGFGSSGQFLNQYLDFSGNISDNNSARLQYLLELFGPLLFVPFLVPSVLVISLPSFAEILLSPNAEYFYSGQHYSALVIPVIFFSLILAIRKIMFRNCDIVTGWREKLPIIILIRTIIAMFLWSPVIPPLQYAIDGRQIPTWEHGPVLHQVIDTIPEDESLAAPMNILPFLSNRRELYLEPNQNADIVLLDSHLPEYASRFEEKYDDILSEYDRIINRSGVELFVKKNRADLKERILLGS